ncbi:MAG: uL15 family ribosomal protein, partial [Candidatus Berkelbacteria bacterium]|nr:uL15 family ribosomal protein [Candidatus Berkelbacteria bacterium]
MKLHKLQSIKTRKKKRLGRGLGSGKGTYSSRGIKGQKSRSGYNIPSFPSVAKLPKLRGEGFTLVKKIRPQAVSLGVIDKEYKAGETVSVESLIKKKLVKAKIGQRSAKVKLLCSGKLTKNVKFDSNILFSKKA